MKYTPDRALVLSIFDIGENQSETPEGYLYCRSVPIARVGTQQYLNEELEPDAQGGPDGVIHVMRQPEDVFHEDTIASFEGKPVTDDHPPEMLNPDNIHEHQVGTILNARRGQSDQMDFLIADLLITRKDAIAAVRAGKRQVSCGYGSEYESLAPGRARQHTIIGNHVALVAKGRCGPSCAIGDEDMVQKVKDDKAAQKPTKEGLMTRFKNFLDEAFATGEEGELTFKDESLPSKSGMEAHESVGTDSHIHIHLGPNDATTIAPTTDKKAKDAKPVKDKKAKDMKPAKDDEGTAEEMETEDAKPDEDEGKEMKDAFMDAMSKHYDAEMGKVKDKKPSKDKKMKDAAAKKDDDEDDDTETKDAATEEEGEAESEGSVESADADPDEDKDDKKKDNKDKKPSKDKKATTDSAPLKADFIALRSDVEILAPGLKLPTFDAAAPQTATMDSMCLLRRRALAASNKTEEGKDVLTMLNGGKSMDIKTLTCDAAGVFFNSAVVFARDRNNDVGRLGRARPTKDAKGPPASPAEFNARAAAFYEAQKPKVTTKSA